MKNKFIANREITDRDHTLLLEYSSKMEEILSPLDDETAFNILVNVLAVYLSALSSRDIKHILRDLKEMASQYKTIF